MSNLSDYLSRVSLAIGGNTSGALSTVGNGTFVLAGGPNVTLSQVGRTVTISANAGGGGGGGGAAISAGASSQSTGTVIFSNSNSLSFGLNNGTLTGSFSTQPETPFGVSAGTQSVSTGTVVFSNSNGISFGLSGSSRITASYTVPTVPAQISVGNSNLGNTLGDTGVVTGRLVLVGNPNITLSGSTNGGSMTITISGGAGAAGNTGFISAGAATASLGTVVFSNSNSVSFGVNGQTVTASFSTQPETPFAISAGTQSVSTGTMVFSDSNNIAFGMSGSSRVTASAALSMFAVSNTTQSTSGSANISALSFAGAGIASVGVTGGSVVISVPSGGGAAGSNTFGMSNLGNTSGTSGVISGSALRLLVAGGNNITLSQSINGDSATITVSGPQPGGITLGGNSTSAGAGFIFISSGTMTLAGGNNVTLSQNGNAVTISGPNTAAQTPFGISAGTQSVSTGTMVFSDSNNVTFGMSGSSRITASASFPAETPFGISAGTQSVSTGTMVFSNSNNVSFGMSGSSRITASASFPAETPFGISAGTQSVSTGTMVFSNSNGITFGMSGSSRITASYTVPPSFSAGVSTGGGTSGATGVTGSRLVFVGTRGISLTQTTDANGGTVSIDGVNTTYSIVRMGFPGNFGNFTVDGALLFYPTSMPNYYSASRAELELSVSLSTSSNSSHAGAFSLFIGMYSRSGSTLSLLSSGSFSAQWTNTSDNSTSVVGGPKRATMTFNMNMTPGEYYVGAILRSTSTNANWFSIQHHGFFDQFPAPADFGQTFNSLNLPLMGHGRLSTTTNALPSSVAFSNLRSDSQYRYPVFNFANFTT